METAVATFKKSLFSNFIVVLYEVELLSYIDHQAADDYDTFTEVNKKLL
mgnify:FL=1